MKMIYCASLEASSVFLSIERLISTLESSRRVVEETFC
jgi:hypothetical protein